MAKTNNRRPEFEKLVIGPLMVFGEMSTGGHYMEMLKIMKQSKGGSYFSHANKLWIDEGVLGFYKGFMPWGFIQIAKGIPVLFIQAECDHYFKQWGVHGKTAEVLSGVLGGMGQGIFMTPTQRLKTIVMTDPKYEGAGAPKTVGEALKATTYVAGEVVKKEGWGTLMKGLGPMMGKRGFDWGFRFWGIGVAKSYLTRDDPKRPLGVLEKMGVGFFGGLVSTATMPLDTWVANCQKASKKLPDGTVIKANAIQVAQDMWRTRGVSAFVSGWNMRVLHAGYHTMWMYSIGSLISDWLNKK
eukprot:TRINITY_DN13072_c0_g1_i1.p2 TRINITY_DN13072_c0_g1~~TRINITY_DN13072_c0_g1_i1.p2  ORF type:complete len:298 (+),score=51.17 TRINITY_DN13072_c0_g1_i1:138-1031(+)